VIQSRMGRLLKANVKGRANRPALAAEEYHESDGCSIALIAHPDRNEKPSSLRAN